MLRLAILLLITLLTQTAYPHDATQQANGHDNHFALVLANSPTNAARLRSPEEQGTEIQALSEVKNAIGEVFSHAARREGTIKPLNQEWVYNRVIARVAQLTEPLTTTCRKVAARYLSPNSEKDTLDLSQALALIPETTPEQKIREAIERVGAERGMKHGLFYRKTFQHVHPDKLSPKKFADECSALLARLKPDTGRKDTVITSAEALRLIDSPAMSEIDEQTNGQANMMIIENARELYEQADSLSCTISEISAFVCTIMEEGEVGALLTQQQINQLCAQRDAAPLHEQGRNQEN